MGNTVWVNADDGSDFHSLADHIKKKNYTKGKIRSVFSVSIFTSINVS